MNLPSLILQAREGPSFFKGMKNSRNLFRFMGMSVFLCCLPVISVFSQTAKEAYRYSHPQMGTQFHVLVYTSDSAGLTSAVSQAFAHLDQLNDQMSDYFPESELNRLCQWAGQDTCVQVSESLAAVIQEAQHFSERTGGAFDITVGPVVRLWRRARRKAALPDPADLAAAKARVGYAAIRMEPERRCVTLEKPNMQLDLGGIAKGYAADAMLSILQQRGFPHTLIDAGGDLVAGPAPPERGHWEIATEILNSQGQLDTCKVYLKQGAIATSGDTYRYVELGGQRYSHLVDPATGIGLTQRRKVTVLAPTGAEADALASAFSVLGPDQGPAFLDRFPKAEVLILFEEEGRWRQLCSPQFLSYLSKS